MDPTAARPQLPSPPPRLPSDHEVDAARDVLDRLEQAALALGPAPAAAPVHAAMGRVWLDVLGDARSAAVCLQNAFDADPGHPETLGAASRLFAAAQQPARALALASRAGAPGLDAPGFLRLVQAALAAGDHESLWRLYAHRAGQTGSAADHAVAAQVLAYRADRPADALELLSRTLATGPDGDLLALQAALADEQGSDGLARLLLLRAAAAHDPTERASLKIAAARIVDDPLEQETLLSEALEDNPGDAAAIALHARAVALRDPGAAAERFGTLGRSLEEHAPPEAAGHLVEAGGWLERSGHHEQAGQMARRALELAPEHPGALRLLQRALLATREVQELALALERAAERVPRALAGELLSRAAALATLPAAAEGDERAAAERATELARRAAEVGSGLASPRGTDLWAALAFRSGDRRGLSAALEQRGLAAQGLDAAQLLVEAAELARAGQDDARSLELLRLARGMDPTFESPRTALLAVPDLPPGERIDLLAEEAASADGLRAAALHAERAALLEHESRHDEAVQACASALTLGGVDAAVLRRLSRLQMRREDHEAGLAVRLQIAQAMPAGPGRAEAYCRAAELAEWRLNQSDRAQELYAAAVDAHPTGAFAVGQLARQLAWTGHLAEAAEMEDRLAELPLPEAQRAEAIRWATALRRAAAPEAADGADEVLRDAQRLADQLAPPAPPPAPAAPERADPVRSLQADDAPEPSPDPAQAASQPAAGHAHLGYDEGALHDGDGASDEDAGIRPEEPVAAALARLLDTPPPAGALHDLVHLHTQEERPDAAMCAAAVLVGLGAATPAETALHAQAVARPPPAELPRFADSADVHADGDHGALRDLLAAAALEIAAARPTDLAARGALVKGDNPVRRVCAAIAAALGLNEPQLYLARKEPGVVEPVVGPTTALLVGTDVPARHSPRQQRFLYGRALAHLRRGTHAVADLSAPRLHALLDALVRSCAPEGTALPAAGAPEAPSADPAVAGLAAALSRDASVRLRLAPLAAKAAPELTRDSAEALRLAIRESANRAGLAICGDPAAALSVLRAECQAGLEHEEIARLARYSVGTAYARLRSQ